MSTMPSSHPCRWGWMCRTAAAMAVTWPWAICAWLLVASPPATLSLRMAQYFGRQARLPDNAQIRSISLPPFGSTWIAFFPQWRSAPIGPHGHRGRPQPPSFIQLSNMQPIELNSPLHTRRQPLRLQYVLCRCGGREHGFPGFTVSILCKPAVRGEGAGIPGAWKLSLGAGPPDRFAMAVISKAQYYHGRKLPHVRFS